VNNILWLETVRRSWAAASRWLV